MRTYYIYKATNKINGKSYIGQTVDYKTRLWQHRRCYEKEDCKFHDAIREFGFIVAVVEEEYIAFWSKHCGVLAPLPFEVFADRRKEIFGIFFWPIGFVAEDPLKRAGGVVECYNSVLMASR